MNPLLLPGSLLAAGAFTGSIRDMASRQCMARKVFINGTHAQRAKE